MTLAAARKVLLFGLVGAAGCLAGWPVGEGVLAAARVLAPAGGTGASLVSAASPPATEAPPPSAEFRDRLAREKAKSGDVQVSLLWYDTNDLDLHCVGPDGFEIFYATKGRPSPTGGELDVDANAACHDVKPAPVENVYWPTGAAPAGRYQVYVNYFQRCGSGPAESRYKVNVQSDNQRQEIDGTIAGRTGKRLVYEFELQPRLEVYGPDKPFDVTAGSMLKVPVVVRRSATRGPVRVVLDGLPAGVTAAAMSLAPGEDRGEIELTAALAASPGAVKPKLTATADALTATRDLEMTVTAVGSGGALAAVVPVGLWTALIAAGLTAALLAGQNYYLGKGVLPGGPKALALVTGGAAVGFVSGSVGQGLYALFGLAGAAGLGFAGGWALLGGLLGWGVGFFLPNLDARKAALAGVVGGLLGAGGFFAGSVAAEWAGRLLGVVLLGFCIGLMVAVVEAAFRSAWLEVRYGPREVVTVNLGPEPVRVGGDARQCTVWARGAAPVALRYWVRDGKAVCEDAATRQTTDVRDGDRRSLGPVEVVVRTGAGGPVAPRRPVHSAPNVEPLSLDPDPPPPKPAAVNTSWDDLPAPVVPPAPPRAPAPPAPKPAAPVAAPRPAAPPAPPKPAAPKPPAAAKPADPDACPYCRNGTKHPGRPGARYCVIHDQSY